MAPRVCAAGLVVACPWSLCSACSRIYSAIADRTGVSGFGLERDAVLQRVEGALIIRDVSQLYA